MDSRKACVGTAAAQEYAHMAEPRILARTAVAHRCVATGGGGGSVRSAVVLGSVHMAGFGLSAGTVAVLRYACMDPGRTCNLNCI